MWPAFFRPNGMTLSQKVSDGMIKEVFARSSGHADPIITGEPSMKETTVRPSVC